MFISAIRPLAMVEADGEEFDRRDILAPGGQYCHSPGQSGIEEGRPFRTPPPDRRRPWRLARPVTRWPRRHRLATRYRDRAGQPDARNCLRGGPPGSASTTRRCSRKSRSELGALLWTRRRARLASWRAATGERWTISEISSNVMPKTSWRTKASRSAGSSVSSMIEEREAHRVGEHRFGLGFPLSASDNRIGQPRVQRMPGVATSAIAACPGTPRPPTVVSQRRRLSTSPTSSGPTESRSPGRHPPLRSPTRACDPRAQMRPVFFELSREPLHHLSHPSPCPGQRPCRDDEWTGRSVTERLVGDSSRIEAQFIAPSGHAGSVRSIDSGGRRTT